MPWVGGGGLQSSPLPSNFVKAFLGIKETLANGEVLTKEWKEGLDIQIEEKISKRYK